MIRRKKLDVELPPRARRIPQAIEKHGNESGTTSACAENTAGSLRHHLNMGNYLRVRGEYLKIGFGDRKFRELPPRARRILDVAEAEVVHDGTTSACAENTMRVMGFTLTGWNYLRVRGEYH